jgi:hypothetical protein
MYKVSARAGVGRLTESKGPSSDGLVGDVGWCTKDLDDPASGIASIGGRLVESGSWDEPAVRGRLKLGEPILLVTDWWVMPPSGRS